MEILSPAGNMESLTAAVRTGADAVYLGLKDFSARKNADNFSFDELSRAIKYCHTAGVKVYVAINTMIKESELPDALFAAEKAVNSGADAFIVSDLGLVSILRKALPQVPLHASTQMTVHSPAALSSLKKLGIKRVVLGREMSRDEIKRFCREAEKDSIEVEIFVHGALCMCVSGKCLLSSVMGGRSGNRGYCAGPCRLEFSSSDTGRYDLSLKDLSLIEYLSELEQLGITSAKIEGRMKRPEYVAAATAACKAVLAGAQDSKLQFALKDVFSRSGFTDGYYKGVLGSDMFGIRTKEDAEISKSAFSYLHSLYRAERQRVPVTIKADIKNGEKIKITVCDKSNSAVVYGEKPEIAQNSGITRDSVKASLSKLGGTPYFAESVGVEVDDGLYVSASTLNELRREAIAKLDCLRAKTPYAMSVSYNLSEFASNCAAKQGIYAMFIRSADIPKNLTGAKGVILPLFEDFSRIPKKALKIASLPRYIANEVKITARLKELKSAGVFTAYCDNLSALELAKSAGFKVIASNGFNCASRESVSALNALGADTVTLSAEVYMPAAKDIANCLSVGLFAYGRLPLMLTRNCPVKNTKTCAQCKGQSHLTDRKGVKFPVRCRDGYSELFNSTPIYLADKKKDLSNFDFLLLNFVDEPPELVQKIINDYVYGALPQTEFTRGLYYKNIR